MERVLILGATSAIAAEVAILHARRGDRLHLVGRSDDKLAALVARCTGEGTTDVSSRAADFADLAGNGPLAESAIAALGGLDRVLIAHGVLGDQLESERSFDEAERILAVNFVSVVGLLIPLANHLEGQGSGRIGVMTSVAGDRGRPRNYTYGAAKGGLNIYLQGLRTRLYRSRVSVTTLKLGPVDTPMTETHAKNALFGDKARVAADIVKAIDRRRAEAYVPFFWRGIMPLVKNTPEPVFQRIPFLSGR